MIHRICRKKPPRPAAAHIQGKSFLRDMHPTIRDLEVHIHQRRRYLGELYVNHHVISFDFTLLPISQKDSPSRSQTETEQKHNNNTQNRPVHISPLL